MLLGNEVPDNSGIGLPLLLATLLMMIEEVVVWDKQRQSLHRKPAVWDISHCEQKEELRGNVRGNTEDTA